MPNVESVAAGRTMSTIAQRGVLLALPAAVGTALFVSRRTLRLQLGPDQGVFVGMVRSLRDSGSLASVTDAFWIRLSPAETVDRLGRIPVADFGPVYAVTVAVTPAPLAVAFVVVHALAVFVALASVSYLTWRATQSFVMAAVAASVAVWGPFTADLIFGDLARPLDILGTIGSDGLAAATFLAGLAVLATIAPASAPRADARPERWWCRSVLAAGLLATAVLTRYAMAGAVIGLLATLGAARLRTGDRRWVWPATALGLATAWVVVVAPVLAGTGGPKTLAAHPIDVAPLGTVVAGWFGLSLDASAAVVALVAFVVVLVGVAALARAGGIVALAAAAGLFQLAAVGGSRAFLDISLNLREERHLLLVRFLIAVVLVAGVAHGARAAAAALVSTERVRRVGVAAAGAAIAVLSAWLADGGPGPAPEVAGPPPLLAASSWLAARGELPVVTNVPDIWYVRTGRPAVDVPRRLEWTTLAPRDVAAEISDLASVAPRVVVAHRPGVFEGVDLRMWPCSRVEEILIGPDLDGFELAVVDLRACAALGADEAPEES